MDFVSFSVPCVDLSTGSWSKFALHLFYLSAIKWKTFLVFSLVSTLMVYSER